MTALTLRAPEATDRGPAPRLRQTLRAIHALVHRDLLRLACQRAHTGLVLLQRCSTSSPSAADSPP
ncbi:hypothetical protein [Streptomyces showdoensis]|uniref:hypothetical protein n=1 Tax=Streptomyces showdoensis TaxID=68268 RepID=UPI0031E89404